MKITTGSTRYSKVKNIYNMAGNVYEWSMEIDYRNRMVFLEVSTVLVEKILE